MGDDDENVPYKPGEGSYEAFILAKAAAKLAAEAKAEEEEEEFKTPEYKNTLFGTTML